MFGEFFWAREALRKTEIYFKEYLVNGVSIDLYVFSIYLAYVLVSDCSWLLKTVNYFCSTSYCYSTDTVYGQMNVFHLFICSNIYLYV